MSDYIAELRADLVEAAARQQRRGPVGRAIRAIIPGTWTPLAVAGGLAVAGAIVAAFLSVLLLAPKPPQPEGKPRVAGAIAIGGIPEDAVFGHGSLWVTDFRGDVLRIDPVHRRVLARIPIGAGTSPSRLAIGPDAVWVSAWATQHTTQLLRIDPARDRVVLRRPLGLGEDLAVSGGAIWVAQPTDVTTRGGVLARSPVTGRLVARLPVPRAAAVVAVGTTLWILDPDGTVSQFDGPSKHVVHRLPGVAPHGGAPDVNRFVADAGGAWVLSDAQATILRIEDGRVTRRIPVPADTQILAEDGRSLWLAAGANPGSDHRLRRIDTRTGRVAASVDLGRHQPAAIVPAPAAVYVVTTDGRVLIVRRS
jgi:DNA-binding beta-propeller fold protein YncE